MAFTSTLLNRYPCGEGLIREVWSWSAASVTTGTITPDTTDALGIGEIKQIDSCSSTVTSTDAALVLTYTNNVARAAITVTCTSDSTGVITLDGKAM